MQIQQHEGGTVLQKAAASAPALAECRWDWREGWNHSTSHCRSLVLLNQSMSPPPGAQPICRAQQGFVTKGYTAKCCVIHSICGLNFWCVVSCELLITSPTDCSQPNGWKVSSGRGRFPKMHALPLFLLHPSFITQWK